MAVLSGPASSHFSKNFTKTGARNNTQTHTRAHEHELPHRCLKKEKRKKNSFKSRKYGAGTDSQVNLRASRIAVLELLRHKSKARIINYKKSSYSEHKFSG